MYIKVGENWYEVQAPEQVDEAYIDGLDPDKVKKALDNKRRFDPVHKRVNTKSMVAGERHQMRRTLWLRTCRR